ncbi:unnamed protein product, partial [Oppiella nova]
MMNRKDSSERLKSLNWSKELTQKECSFTRATIKTFGPKMIFPFLLILFGECGLKIAQPLFLGYVIRYFADPDHYDYHTACWYALGVVGVTFLHVSTYHPAAVFSCRVATKARVAWCTLMYKKALRLKHSAFKQTTIGQILNLMSNDVSKFDEFCISGSYIIVAPIQTVIGVYICYIYVGWTCFIGLAILFCFIPFNSV